MFGTLGDLAKAAVGVVIETPIAVVADVVPMGGALTDKDQPYTATALEKVTEIFDNSRDEAMGGFANDIEIAFLPNNRVRIS